MRSTFCDNCPDKAHLCNKTCPKIHAHTERRKVISEAIKLDEGPWKPSVAREKGLTTFYKVHHTNKTNNLY